MYNEDQDHHYSFALEKSITEKNLLIYKTLANGSPNELRERVSTNAIQPQAQCDWKLDGISISLSASKPIIITAIAYRLDMLGNIQALKAWRHGKYSLRQ